MPEERKLVRVAVNVMRARLTVIGFNIAIVSFQIVQLDRVSGGVRVPGIDHAVHIGADMALFMALALSLIALVAFIMSCAYDEVGYCTHWTLVAGDLLMYLALAHTAAGFFQPANAALEIYAAKVPDQVTQIGILHVAMAIAGMVSGRLCRTGGCTGTIPFSASHQHRPRFCVPGFAVCARMGQFPCGSGGSSGFRGRVRVDY
jgi:hypothetical protein